MSFLRHREIYPSDGSASPAADAPAHRLDEFPAGYSLAVCSPAWPASASPTGSEYAITLPCRSSSFDRTANSVLTVCVRRGGRRTPVVRNEGSEALTASGSSRCVCEAATPSSPSISIEANPIRRVRVFNDYPSGIRTQSTKQRKKRSVRASVFSALKA